MNQSLLTLKSTTTIVLLLFSVLLAYAQHEFITTWDTTKSGSSNSTSIRIPTFDLGYNYDVDWNNDGTFDESGITGDVTHDFGVSGTYTIRIQGSFPRIYFNNQQDKLKILSVDQWGTNPWTSMENAFVGAENLIVTATDSPNLSNLISLKYMFGKCISFNSDINAWDTATVINMEYMFYQASSFNQNIGLWNVSNVTSFTDMLLGAGLSSTNYDALLIGWDAQNLSPNESFHGGDSQYCSIAAQNARQHMIDSDGWAIEDGGFCDGIK